ncbi:MAG: thioesterase domain-containing protein [Planctomycetota bacterium]
MSIETEISELDEAQALPGQDFVWLKEPSEDSNSPIVIGFPFSGSGAAMFASWKALLPENFALAAVQMPGRESRLHEPACNDVHRAADGLVDSFTSNAPHRPLICVGCSNGALLAYEFALRITKAGYSIPLLVVAAKPSLTHEIPKLGLDQLSDEELLDLVGNTFGALPPEVTENEELRRLMLPTLRADLEMGDNYVYKTKPPLDSDILALVGSDDLGVRLQWMEDWRLLGRGFRARTFAGGHFFIRQQTRAVIDTIVMRYEAAWERTN